MKDQYKLDKSNVEDIISLSPMQEGMLFHYLENQDKVQYFEQLSLNISGEIDKHIFTEAWNHVVENNQVLRTVFKWDKLESPVQIILRKHNVPFRFIDISYEVKEGKYKNLLLKEIREEDIKYKLDISKEPFRIILVRVDDKEYEMIISFHHILYDGWSSGIILREFSHAYSDIYNGIELKALKKTSFKEFVKWCKSRDKILQREYWSHYLRGFDGAKQISVDHTSLNTKHQFEKVTYKLSEIEGNNVVKFCREHSITAASLFYSVWGIILQKYNIADEAIFGTTVSGRNAKISGIEDIAGLFINTLPLIVRSNKNTTAMNVIKTTEDTLRSREEYECTPLVDIRDYSGMNTFDSMFNSIVVFENYPLSRSLSQTGECIKINSYSSHEVTNYELTIAIEAFDNFELNFIFDKDVFEASTIERLSDCYINALLQIVERPNCFVSQIGIISEEEKRKLLYEFNDTKAEYPKDKTIHELFEEQAERTPDNIAVVYENSKLTYRELNERANSLARLLRENGIGPDKIVGIMVERSIEMIAGIVGILKAGGAYLPIDPEYPEDRIRYMLEDSGASVLLTQRQLRNKCIYSENVIELDIESIYEGDKSNLEKVNQPNDLAYVIYTSGSTGKPKGVMVEHRNLVNQINGLNKRLGFDKVNNHMLLSNVVFDVSVQQIFAAIVLGAKLHIIADRLKNDYEKLWDYIYKNDIQIINTVPSLMEIMLEHVKENLKVRSIMLGGDILTTNLYERVKNKIRSEEIVNIYGPTETTINAAFYRCTNDEQQKKVSIGKPMSNTKIYILDKYYNLQPIGVAGELCISGEGVARGYLNRSELTAEKFVENPFEPGARMYKTGDLARWLPDGNLEFLGRIDHQVKIRGFRIELGEIESRLIRHKNIKEALVVVKEDESGSKYLCAYIVGDKELTISELREHVGEELPEYMIPSCFIQLEKMPLNNNGKIDRKALPEPSGQVDTGAEYEAPGNEIEEKLVEIWEDVLKLEKIGINDNFFALGGHSLKATSLTARIHKELNVEVPLREIFKSPTIKGLADYIRGLEENIYEGIEKAGDKESYELSSAQKRLYTLQQFDIESTAYNMPTVLEVEGELVPERLEEAFRKLIKRHEALRTSFEIEEGIVQRIHKEAEFEIEYREAREEDIGIIVKEFVRAFNLSKAPLLRVGLVKVHSKKHILMIDMHHIISDGTSMGIIVDEFAKAYEGEELKELRIQYKDYAEWQNKMLKSERIKKQEEYWLEEFKGEIPVLNLPTDYQRPSIQSFEGDGLRFELGEELTKGLRRISKETGATMYMVLLAGFNVLLAKYSGQEDIVVGSPIAGRPHVDLDNIMGMFVNTLAIRNYPKGDKTFREFLEEVKVKCLKAYENQDYQFEELVEKLDIRRDMSRNPIFDVMLVLQNTDIGELKIKGLNFKQYIREHTISKFDILIELIEERNTIILGIEYCTKIFKRETIERLERHLTNIFESIIENTDSKLEDIEILGEEEKKKLLYEFNDTRAEYPKYKTMNELFEEQVLKTPDRVAVVYQEEKLTYRELNERANSLARLLREKGIGPDKVVGMMVTRSLELIIGIMGILKAGGAYLAIDKEYPKDRIKYMLEDGGVEVLLTQRPIKDNVDFDGVIIELDDKSIYENEKTNLNVLNRPDDLIYIIYTSGSTGKPKGIQLMHKNLVNLIWFQFDKTDVNFEARVLQFASISFDVSYQEIFSTLLMGGKLYLITEETRLDANKLLDFIDENEIEVVYLPTSYLKYISNNESYINRLSDKINNIITAGEQLIINKALKNYLIKNNVKLHNHYGPSETHVATVYDILPYDYIMDIPPIGKPISNLKIYILNRKLHLSSIGVVGELCISGEGVARGYLNRPELTAEKFVENPFEPGARMYKTGDLARWLPDGNLEFLGRIDHQVKIRGFRIELGEIESRLIRHENIKEALVIVKEDESGSKYLCAYIVGDKELTTLELREHVGEELPEYMIPSCFIQLEKMPLNNNGKIDRKALPEPSGQVDTGAEYEAPGNEIEEKLAGIWEDVLKLEKIGINDNFFALGGHSLKATSLTARIHKELNVEVPLREIFKSPTIKGLADYIRGLEENIYEGIEKAGDKESYELSSAQKRLYTLQQFDLESTAYNMPTVLEIEGELVPKRLEEAFRKLIKRHEALRTSFEIEEGIVQRINKEAEFETEYREAREDDIEIIVKEFVRAFDLSKAPLLRVGLVKVQPERHILMIDMHHIISDGTSMGIIVDEFAKAYEGEELKELRIQYKDYAEWQNKMQNSERIKEQEEYWLEEFKGEIPVLNLPTDYQRPSIQSFEGDGLRFELGEELTKGLRRISKETGATMYMVLLAGFSVLLAKYSGQEDIVVGSPIAGRPHADLDNIMGMFVNTLAIRNYPKGDKTFREFLEEVKVKCLNAYENQDYQFEELVEKLDIRRDMSRNPIFDVMLVLQNTDIGELKIKGLNFKQYIREHTISKFDITLNIDEQDSVIDINIEYCKKLFNKETVQRLSKHFINILISIAGNINAKISEMQILGEEEEKRLLYEFNDTKAEYPKDKTIHELFEKQVERTPDKIAVVYEDSKLTYRELNERANSLARVLRVKGIGPDKIAAIMVDKSLEMVVGIIGILKAGGAYLPIDPEYPKDRIKYMLEDSEAKILLTNKYLMDKIQFKGDLIELEDRHVYEESTSNLEMAARPHNLAYIIYTSGTTGKPKGVMIEHQNVVRLMFNDKVLFDFTENDTWTMFHSVCFDFSVWEMYGALLYGGKLVMVRKMLAQNPKDYLLLLKKEKVTVLNQTPTAFYNLINEELQYESKELSIRYIIFGGEALKPGMLRHWKEKYPETKLINMYGITETTVHVTFKEITKREIDNNISNIGKPIPTLTTYVMDKNMKLQPIGIPGELYVGGLGVGRGYLNRPELTAERFITNPYNIGERLYKSGDLVRLLPDGDMEYLGRVDHQVKIRGFRIELGEIENRLLGYEAIEEVAAAAREDEDGNNYICAYIVGGRDLTAKELRAYLSQALPAYMLPSYFIKLDKMPLTSNGKIDKRSLPKPDGRIIAGAEHVAPRNSTEETLVKIWSEVLGIKEIGISSNFFELGGHSVKAVQAVNLINKQFYIRISLPDIFQNPTIEGLSEIIAKSRITDYEEIEKLPEQECYELSYTQKRLWVINQLEPQSTAYNMPGRITLHESVNAETIDKVFQELFDRHESFRTCFRVKEGNPVQIICEKISFKVPIIDLSQMEKGMQTLELESLYRQESKKVFDLKEAPLMTVKLIKLNERKYELIYCMHHIISDGWSMEILKREFISIYEAYKANKKTDLNPLRIQYKDFAAWQNRQIESSENIRKAKEYWSGLLEGKLPVLNVATKRSGVDIKDMNGAGYRAFINAEIKDGLKAIARNNKTSLFIVLLTAVNIYLMDITGQADILIGAAGSGREHQDLQNVMGYFVNTVILRNRIDEKKEFIELLNTVNQNSLTALEYQYYPLEIISEELNIKYPEIKVFFNMQNMGESEKYELQDIGQYHIEELEEVKFQITFYLREYINGIELICAYARKKYEPETIEYMVNDYIGLLHQISENPKRIVEEYLE